MSNDLELRIAGLEAMLCDAQKEVEELRAALRPFADAYRNAKAKGTPCAILLAGEGRGQARVGHFWRAAELMPKTTSMKLLVRSE